MCHTGLHHDAPGPSRWACTFCAPKTPPCRILRYIIILGEKLVTRRLRTTLCLVYEIIDAKIDCRLQCHNFRLKC